MTKLKTLKELADEHGFPFEAELNNVRYIFVDIVDKYINGFDKSSFLPIHFNGEYRVWTMPENKQKQ